MILGRLIMRILLVPLGSGIAVFTAVLFVIAAHWNRFAALVAADRGGDEFAVALLFVGSWIALVAAVSAAAMMLPAILGVLIAESFAIRSWMFHVVNGGLSAWVGHTTFADVHKPYEFFDDPLIVVGAGIAAGFAYWLVAGWSAGFWKPVFAPRSETESTPK